MRDGNKVYLCLPNPEKEQYCILSFDVLTYTIDTFSQGYGTPYYNQDWSLNQNPKGVLIQTFEGVFWHSENSDRGIKFQGSSGIVHSNNVSTIQSYSDSIIIRTFDLRLNNLTSSFTILRNDLPKGNEFDNIELPKIHTLDIQPDKSYSIILSYVLSDTSGGLAFVAKLSSKSVDSILARELGDYNSHRIGLTHPVEHLSNQEMLIAYYRSLLKISKNDLSLIWDTELPREMLTSRVEILNDTLAIWLGENSTGYLISVQNGSIERSFNTSYTPSRPVVCNGSIYFVNLKGNVEILPLNGQTTSSIDSIITAFPESLYRAIGTVNDKLIMLGQDSLYLAPCPNI